MNAFLPLFLAVFGPFAVIGFLLAMAWLLAS
jgi:hypothetical protein